MQIPEYLASRHIPFETLYHPPAYSAQKRAKYLHLPGKKVAKSVLLKGPVGLMLAILPADKHVDTSALSLFLQGSVRLATDCEIETAIRDCEWGVVPPFGQPYGFETVIDDAFSPDDYLVFEGNSHAEAFRLSCRDYERLEQPRRLKFAR